MNYPLLSGLPFGYPGIMEDGFGAHGARYAGRGKVWARSASVAQLVELLICNQWVGGSSPSAGSRCL